MAKIISKRGKQPEVDIELDLNALDELVNADITHEDGDEPEQLEFEYYEESWVIQGLVKLGAWVVNCEHEEMWTVFFRSEEVTRFTETALQSDPDVVYEYACAIIETMKQEQST